MGEFRSFKKKQTVDLNCQNDRIYGGYHCQKFMVGFIMIYRRSSVS